MNRVQRNERLVLFVQNGRSAHHPRHHHRLAAALAAAGYRAMTLSQPDLEPGHSDAVPVEYLPIRGSRLTRMASAPLTLSRAARRRPWAIHVTTLELLPWAVLLRKVRGGVVLYDSNDQYDSYMLRKEWLPRRIRPLVRSLVRWLEPWLASQLDAATTALPSTQAKFIGAGVRSTLIRNFPPSTIATPVRGGDGFDFDILVGGSIHALHAFLADTAAELRRLLPRRPRWLVAARNATPADQAVLEDALGARDVRDDFKLLYNRPFSDMSALVASSRIGFIFYRGERVPQRMFEYMASGLPFVASDLPTTTQFTADHGVADLAPPDDPAASALALAGLLKDEGRRAEMSRRGPLVAREHYSWECEAERLIELYDELHDESSVRRR